MLNRPQMNLYSSNQPEEGPELPTLEDVLWGQIMYLEQRLDAAEKETASLRSLMERPQTAEGPSPLAPPDTKALVELCRLAARRIREAALADDILHARYGLRPITTILRAEDAQ